MKLEQGQRRPEGVKWDLKFAFFHFFFAFFGCVDLFPFDILLLIAKLQGPVVQKVDNAIHRINRYPVDKS